MRLGLFGQARVALAGEGLATLWPEPRSTPTPPPSDAEQWLRARLDVPSPRRSPLEH